MDLTPDEQEAFDELAARARHLEPADTELQAPPPDVWEAIEAALAEPDPADERVPLAAVDSPPGAPPATSFAAASADRRDASGRARWVVSAVGIAALVILLALGAWLLSGSGSDTIIGRTELEALDDPGAVVGDARVVDVDGELRLQINTEALDPGDDGYLEVWVIDPDITELVSLGPVRPDGTYDLPAGLDPERFPIVDISREPLNGDPTHSGDSLVQGQLEFT
jgi:hypothetical protein